MQLKLGAMALITAFMLPSQVFAASCNTDLNLKLRGPGGSGDLIFVEDIINAKMILNTADLEPGTYIDIPNFGFASDCEQDADLTFDNCQGQQNAINFGVGSGQVVATCLSEDGVTTVEFPPLQSNRVEFIPKDGRKMRVEAGDACSVSWDFQVSALFPFDNPPKMVEMWQVVSFPLSREWLEPDPYFPAECSNGLQTTEDRQARMEIHTCEVEVEKQICAIGGDEDCGPQSTGWKDANISPGIDLGADGNAVYRAIVKNTGSAPFLGDIRIDDDDLNVSNYTVSWDPDNDGEMIVTNNAVFKQSCNDLNPIDNTLQVTAWCRTTSGAEVKDVATDVAWGDCDNYRPPSPKLSLKKDASPAKYTAQGEKITYTYTLTNIGNTVLWPPYTVSDDKINAQNESNGGSKTVVCENPNDSLPILGEKKCTATYVITAADLEAGSVTNIANATAKDAETGGNDVKAGPVDKTVTGPPPVIEVDKSSDVTVNNDGTIDVEYTVKVSNTGARSGTYTLVDTLELDGGLFFEKIVSNVAYDAAGSTDSLAGVVKTPTEADYLTGATLIEDETIAAGKHEQFKFTLRFSIDGKNTNVEGTNCDDKDDTDGDTGMGNLVEVFVDDSKVDESSVCDPFSLSPEIELIKEIWDEDLEKYVETAGPVAPPSGATYRMKVRNAGNILLTNVTISDPMINGGAPFNVVGDLPVDGPYVTISVDVDPLDDNYWGDLVVEEVCSTSGSETNVATAVGQWDPNDASKKVNDTGQAKLICAGDPKVEIKKQVSVDGGKTWWDADDEEGYSDYPEVYFDPDGVVKTPVKWRLLIYNVGDVILDPATVDDARLWAGDKDISPLEVPTDPAVPVRIITGDTPNFSELNEADVCQGASGSVTNLAGVTVTEKGGSSSDRDTDTAGVLCVEQPAIKIVKETSFTGNTDEYSNSVTATALADGYWRFIISNEGGVDLSNVVVEDRVDGVLLFQKTIADLPANSTVTIDYMTTGFETLLFTENFCDSTFSEPYVNTAKVTADPANGGASVSDSDSATYDCADQRTGDICYDDDGTYLGKPKAIKVQYDPTPGNVIQDPGTTPIIWNSPDNDFPVGNVPVDIYIFDHRASKRIPLEVPDWTGALPLSKVTFSGPKGMVAPNTLIEIYGDCDELDVSPSCETSLIQTIEFHTSCSQVISAGDKYGAIRIIDRVDN